MRLDQLVEGIGACKAESPLGPVDIVSIDCDSRKAVKGGLFVALEGLSHDGADFIEDAVGKGVFAVAAGRRAAPLRKPDGDVCFLTVDDPKEFLHRVVRRFYGNPSSAVRTIGVTGTNGKTTVTYLIESVMKEAGRRCGVIGTVNYRRGDVIMPAGQTTPDFVDNQRFLSDLARRHISHCVMEVSSHALAQDRVYGIDFSTAVFTNLTSDHLDYHKTRENYFAAKANLFTALSPESTAAVNTDDPCGRRLLSMTGARVITYGIERQAEVMARDIHAGIDGSRFTLTGAAGEIEIRTRLIGAHNVYNILAAVSACFAEGLSLNAVKNGIEHLTVVPGRLERVEGGQDFFIFIDYAHTQDALENVMTAVRGVGSNRIILVFGCGGDRDSSKRAPMGRTAGRLADLSIVTSDNPRGEDPQSIIDQIILGFERDNYRVILHREEAIAQALATARSGDIVLIAGKGHEMYQTFADKRVDFDERRIVEKCLKR